MKKYSLVIGFLFALTSAHSQNWIRTTTGTTYTYLNSTAVGDRIGIGPFTATTVPLAKFEVSNQTSPSSSDLIALSMHSITYNPTLKFFRTRGTISTYSDVIANDIAANIVGSARIASNNRDVASIQMGVGSTLSSSSAPGYISFSTVPTNSIALAERMRITDVGNVGINTTAANIFERLHITGSTRADRFNSTSGVFSTIGATNLSFYTNALAANGTGGSLWATILNSNGYMGIGSTATNPVARLHVDITSTNTNYTTISSSDLGLLLKNTSATANNMNVISFSDANGTGVAQVGSVLSDHTNHTGSLFFATKANGGALTQRMIINEAGNVGIGTTPSQRLHVTGGNILFDNGATPTLYTGTGTTELGRYLLISNSSGLATPSGFKAGGVLVADSYTYANPGKNDLVVKGVMSIGTPFTTTYTLAVNGKIGAKDLQIERNSAAWPDYVFNDTYELAPLSEVEQFIQENNHLKDVPSAQTVEKEGYSVSALDEVLLKKVEELTLYLIAQQKEIDALKKELAKR